MKSYLKPAAIVLVAVVAVGAWLYFYGSTNTPLSLSLNKEGVPTEQEQSLAEEAASADYVGVGVEFSANSLGGMRVVGVARGSGAEEAGVTAGDVITAIDGAQTASRSVEELEGMLRGREGTTASLDLLRNGTALTLAVVRKPILSSSFPNPTSYYETADSNDFVYTSCAPKCVEELVDGALKDEASIKLYGEQNFNEWRRQRLLYVDEHAVYTQLQIEGPAHGDRPIYKLDRSTGTFAIVFVHGLGVGDQPGGERSPLYFFYEDKAIKAYNFKTGALTRVYTAPEGVSLITCEMICNMQTHTTWSGVGAKLHVQLFKAADGLAASKNGELVIDLQTLEASVTQ